MIAPARVDELLVVRFATPHRTLSWAVANGGLRRTRAVVWRRVGDDELLPDVDPAQLLRDSLARHDLKDAVGLLTARDLDTFDCVSRTLDGVTARAVATVGLGNALAAGDPPGPMRVGTINVLVQLSHALDDGGLAEALALSAEARTAALLEARVPSRRSSRWASGTGTDCIVVAAPDAGAALGWVGKHTVAGALIGGVVRDAVARGIDKWLAQHATRARLA
jgi:adenosylcobinamide amidohydrolase